MPLPQDERPSDAATAASTARPKPAERPVHAADVLRPTEVKAPAPVVKAEPHAASGAPVTTSVVKPAEPKRIEHNAFDLTALDHKTINRTPAEPKPAERKPFDYVAAERKIVDPPAAYGGADHKHGASRQIAPLDLGGSYDEPAADPTRAASLSSRSLA